MTNSLLHHNGPPLTDLLPVMMDPRKLTPLGQETRTHSPELSRQRNGAYGCSIARELADRELWTERYHCPTWLDYLRQRNRPTQSERLLQDRALEFHLGPGGGAHSPDARETIWLCTLEGRDT